MDTTELEEKLTWLIEHLAFQAQAYQIAERIFRDHGEYAMATNAGHCYSTCSNTIELCNKMLEQLRGQDPGAGPESAGRSADES